MKNCLITSCLLWLSFCCGFCLFGQDLHVSQYFNSPVFLNPAAVGLMDAKVRLQGGYRQQWSSVFSGYQSSLANADFSLGNMGLGISLMSDDAGSAGLKHTQAELGFAYHLDLVEDIHLISIGLQAGFIQKRFDPVQFEFGSQWDPDRGFNPDIPSGEALLNQQVTAGDFSSGFAYTYRAPELRNLMGIHLGFAFHHINQPKISFFSDEVVLPMRITATGRIDLLGGERLNFSPTFLWMRQGTAQELTAGLILNYELDQEVKVQAGALYRIQDAMIPYVGLHFNGMDIGLSYDMNISGLSAASQLRGGWEVMLAYVWDGELDPKTNYSARKDQSLRDQDGDGIKDRNDKCPDIPGLRRFSGCPDSDGDGIVDSEDMCPTKAGPKERSGCPALDRDGDGVLDGADDCPDKAGLIAFKGCPDSDNDGLPDNVDKCPTDPGPRERSGCPSSDIDADGDGIPDKVDMCPTISGPADFQGCPDTDLDGISDFEDLCPKQAGLRENNGCPVKAIDSDRDGIMDPQDKCPMVPGLPQFAGCPDTDGDGITDFEDKCPLTAGTIVNQGCPDQNMDADGDGVLNQVDRCPYVPGLVNFQGCPDTDKDGLSDLDDACPLIPGPMDRKGCPLQSATGQNTGFNTGNPLQPKLPQFGPVEFDTDQAIIKPHYFPMLNELSEFMLQNPGTKLMLAGHTDNEGGAMYNMVLGQNRAAAIRYYLTIRGVDANRISSVSYGEIMPKSENASTEGKARNRRCELILNY